MAYRTSVERRRSADYRHYVNGIARRANDTPESVSTAPSNMETEAAGLGGMMKIGQALSHVLGNDTQVYAASPIKRKRSTRDEIMTLQSAIIRTIQTLRPPVTLRQLYYAMLPLGLYEKTESAYGRLCHHTMRMRERGIIPYGWFSDNTRWQRKPTTYTGLEEMLEIAAQTYRRALWAESPHYVEIWCEKDALASFFYQITKEYDVPLMVTRGFPSATFTYEAAEQIKAQGKETHIYYFGDYDPSGVLIPQDAARKLRTHGADVHFERVSVNEWQIDAWNLPTRPTKRGANSHAKQFASERSVELDAVPPHYLRDLVTDCIVQHLPRPDEIERLTRIEGLERETLRAMVKGLQE